MFKVAVFLILFISVYVIFKTVKEPDIAKLSLQTEQLVKKGLIDSDISIGQVLQKYQTEQKSSAGHWIKFTKVISVKPSEFYYISKNVKNYINKIKPAVEIQSRKDKISSGLVLSYNSNVLNELIFKYKKTGPKIAIIVDDLGYKKEIKDFLELDIPLTFAIMPNLPYSSFLAEEFKSSSINYILHMPMEPVSYPETDPGENALFTNMNREEIQTALNMALGSVKGAKGLNNHMGSKFTSDSRAMGDLMDILAEKGLFFIDSHTSKKSVGSKIAKQYRVPTVKNNVFLDNKDDYNYIAGRMELLKKTALSRENTIAICHATKKNTARAIKDYLPLFKEEGIRFVAVRELLE
ncbi:MAG: divergent polysaccharide deacetylase family protein [Elusimicrobia bacterium]|nr:divergent polysaccharide deacetylase family protein [Elusimicrobiota bacterium]